MSVSYFYETREDENIMRGLNRVNMILMCLIASEYSFTFFILSRYKTLRDFQPFGQNGADSDKPIERGDEFYEILQNFITRTLRYVRKIYLCRMMDNFDRHTMKIHRYGD